MKTLKQFREENGLADIKPKSDVTGSETELTSELVELLRDKSDSFCRIFNQNLNKDLHPDEENDLKKLIGMLRNLKDSPIERKEKLRDPMDNVVVRPHNGPDGGGGGGEGGGE